jgi:putative methylase
MSANALARQLAVVAGFESPRASLEQYPTPPALAARLIHAADLQGDVAERLVVDLGTGTGMFALGAALRGPAAVAGIDVDPAPLGTARENERRVGTTTPISWVRADATRAPLRSAADADSGATSAGADGGGSAEGTVTSSTPDEAEAPGRPPITVVMNPPFGAQDGSEHADRGFLATAARVADVSYSVHNAGSREFVERFAADNGGRIERAFRAELDLPRQFEFHEADSQTVAAEVFRIEWKRSDD